MARKRTEDELANAQREQEEKLATVWAHKARLEVLACRQFGHSWAQGVTAIFKLGPRLLARELSCSRCGMQRIDAWNRDEYGIVRRWYVAPKDYGRERGEGTSVRIPRHVVHEAMVDRSKQLAPPQHVQELYERWNSPR